MHSDNIPSVDSFSEIGNMPKRPAGFHVRRVVGYILVAFLYALVNLQKNCTAIVDDDLAIAYNKTKKEIGIFSSIYFYPYAGMQIISGLLADIYDPIRVLGIFSILAGIGCIIIALSRNIIIGEIGRALIGIGTGPTYVCSVAFFVAWFKKEQLPVLVGGFIAASSLGGIASGHPLALFCKWFGWKNAFYTQGGVGIFFSLVLIVFIRGRPESFGYAAIDEPQKKRHETFREKLSKLKSNTWTVISYGWFWLTQLFCITSVSNVINTTSYWGGPYLRDVLGYTKIKMGKAMMASHIGVLVGALVIPQFGKLFKAKKWILMCCVTILSCSMWVLFIRGDKVSFLEIWIYFTLHGIFGRSVQSLNHPLIASYYDSSESGTAIGFSNFMTNIVGAVDSTISSFIIPKWGHKILDNGVHKYFWPGYRYGLWLYSSVTSCLAILAAALCKDPESKCCKSKYLDKSTSEALGQSLI